MDISEALSRWGDAAQRGDVQAQYNLGRMYMTSEGSARDYETAYDWLLRAATRGHAEAQNHIGWMFSNALGLPLDGIDAISADKVYLVEVADLPGTTLTPLEISRFYRLFPGEGVGKIDEFLRRVRGIGYSGCLSVEIFNAHYAASVPGEVAARAMRAMTQALQRVK